MSKLTDKLVFSKYIEYFHKENVVVLNTMTVVSILLDQEKYKMWRALYDLKNDREKLSYLVEENKNIKDFVMHLLSMRILTLKEVVVGTEPKAVPGFVYLGLTNSCNFHCKYCYAECETSVLENAERKRLTLEQYCDVIDKLKEIGFWGFFLTGGEPLLEPKVFDIANYLEKKELYRGILTNGSLIHKFDIEKFKVFDSIKISLDCCEPEINDAVRGEGTFQRIERGIMLLREHGIDVEIGSVITKYNKDYLKETIEAFHDKYGIETHVLTNHIPIGRGANDDLSISLSELAACDDVIMNTKLKFQEKDMVSSLKFDGYERGCRSYCCGMGLSEIFIDEFGDVYPCRMTCTEEYLLGNVLEEDLEVIIHKMDDTRKSLMVDKLEGCKECDIRYICGGGCRMYQASYSGSIYKNDKGICDLFHSQTRKTILCSHGLNPTI